MSVCKTVLEEALGRRVSDSDADRLFSKFNSRANALRAADPALGYNDALQRVAREYGEAAELKAILAERNATLNRMRTLEGADYLQGTWKDDPASGLKAMLVGTQDARAGARSSIGADQQAAEDMMLGGLIADIAKVDGGLEAYTKGLLDEDVSRALWRLSEDGDTTGLPGMAVGVAKAIRKWQEYARVTANDAGAWIGQVRGYVASTFHDSYRIGRDMAGWLDTARAAFDLPRMAAEMEVDLSEMDGILEQLWRNFADGVHLKQPQPGQAAAKGIRGMGRKLSHERVIHFKDADAYTAYNTAFGAGTIHEAVAAGLARQAKATAVMQTLGPNYELNFDAMVEQTLSAMKKDKASPEAIARLQAKARDYKRLYLSELDGSLDIPASDTLATVSASIRAIQSMASLGGSTLSSVSDLGVIALGAKYNGVNGLGMIGRGIGNLFSSVPSAEKLELYADLGTVLTSLSGKLSSSRFVPDDRVLGKLGRLQHKFYTLNLQNRWTDAFRESISEMLSANLARRAGEGWDALPEQLRTTLGLYGLEADKWDIVRAAELADVDGSRFLSPKALDDLDDAPFAAYLSKRDLEATPARIRDLRRELQRQLRSYFTDQRDYMMLSPDAATRGLMKQGTQKGTGIGEAVRFIMQFKSFPLAYTQRVIGREFKQGGIAGIASMVALTTLTGYAAMSLKDLAKGKVPRSPDDWRSWVAALQQGGGAGLYGDVLFSQIVDRRFGDAAAQLLGPTFSDVFGSQGLAGIAARAAQGQDAAPAAVRFVQGNTPFLNLFYTRLAMDYLVFYRLQEWMNPGSLGRMEQEMQQRTGQEFIAPPSQAVN